MHIKGVVDFLGCLVIQSRFVMTSAVVDECSALETALFNLSFTFERATWVLIIAKSDQLGSVIVIELPRD